VARRRTATAAKARKVRPQPAPVANATATWSRDAPQHAVKSHVTVASPATEPEALVVTRWFDPGADGDPYSATVRFIGRRLGVPGNPKRDTFVHEETIEGVVPGSGPLSIAAWVFGLQPGEWTVSAELTGGSDGRRGPPGSVGRGPMVGRALPAASWSWRRWSVSPGPTTPVKTRWALPAPLARTPAVLPGSYAALAVAGILVALAVQAAILAHDQVSVSRSLVVSVVALVTGLLGAKLWYAVLHPDESIIKSGWAVDGFLIVAPVVAVVSLLVLDLPIGLVLDAATPGLFFAVAIGRIGCFLTGCCAGRCTRSRWGVWSSDRRIGARRIPTQLIESAAGLLIGLAAVVLLVVPKPSLHGAIFVSAFLLYAIVRQFLLRLRAEQRKSTGSLPATAAAASVVMIVVGVAQILQGR
jgi:phosphatidylglycerol:prolipoprotein diacylglycerol transferase